MTTAAHPLAEPLRAMLPAYLPRQRWYSGPAELDAGEVGGVEVRELWSDGGARSLYQVVVQAAGARYQLVVGQRPAGEPAEFLHGHELAVMGAFGDRYLYDGTLDPELARELLPLVAGGERADHVRPVTAEQSNTSLVFDDRVILKVFRRLHEGRNPDVEVTTALAGAGFTHVARPVGSWRAGDTDLAFAQEFLAGGTEGWKLALTSLRDFYDSDVDDPAEAGGDFSLEANHLGRVTAQLHRSLGEAFGVEAVTAAEWRELVESVARRLEAFVAPAAGAENPLGPDDVASVTLRLRRVQRPGPSLRVHGDYHLGQVMRTDGGWYVLDFEGEPARPLGERERRASPCKDVAGMLRSFDYAARFALAERGATPELEDLAATWVEHNRAAFLEGYGGEAGVQALLPPAGARDDVLGAYELDKALYELDYERAYRPAWEPIPATAIRRITRRLGG